MPLLDGFTAFDFTEGVPYVSFTLNGITFNKSVTIKLGEPEYVRFLINPETKQVAVQVCTQNDKNSTVFYRPKASGAMSVRWNARDLINTIERIMDWDLKKVSYRTDGILSREDNAIIFDLSKATILP